MILGISPIVYTPSFAQEQLIDATGTSVKAHTYSGKAWYDHKEGFDNFEAKDDIPAKGVKIYLQCMNGKGFTSPIFYTTTKDDGSFIFDLDMIIKM